MAPARRASDTHIEKILPIGTIDHDDKNEETLLLGQSRDCVAPVGQRGDRLFPERRGEADHSYWTRMPARAHLPASLSADPPPGSQPGGFRLSCFSNAPTSPRVPQLASAGVGCSQKGILRAGRGALCSGQGCQPAQPLAIGPAEVRANYRSWTATSRGMLKQARTP
jgi:hypothetical protein